MAAEASVVIPVEFRCAVTLNAGLVYPVVGPGSNLSITDVDCAGSDLLSLAAPFFCREGIAVVQVWGSNCTLLEDASPGSATNANCGLAVWTVRLDLTVAEESLTNLTLSMVDAGHGLAITGTASGARSGEVTGTGVFAPDRLQGHTCSALPGATRFILAGTLSIPPAPDQNMGNDLCNADALAPGAGLPLPTCDDDGASYLVDVSVSVDDIPLTGSPDLPSAVSCQLGVGPEPFEGVSSPSGTFFEAVGSLTCEGNVTQTKIRVCVQRKTSAGWGDLDCDERGPVAEKAVAEDVDHFCTAQKKRKYRGWAKGWFWVGDDVDPRETRPVRTTPVAMKCR